MVLRVDYYFLLQICNMLQVSGKYVCNAFLPPEGGSLLPVFISPSSRFIPVVGICSHRPINVLRDGINYVIGEA